MLGLGIGGIIWFFVRAFGATEVSPRWEGYFRWAAGHSFSLYLFHFPLLVFVNSLSWFSTSGERRVLAIAMVLTVSVLLGEWTEAKRKLWQKGFDSLFAKLGWPNSLPTRSIDW